MKKTNACAVLLTLLLSGQIKSANATNITDKALDDFNVRMMGYLTSYIDICAVTQVCKDWHAKVRGDNGAKPFPDYSKTMIVDFGQGLPPATVTMIHFNNIDRFFEVVPQCKDFLTAISLKGVPIPIKYRITELPYFTEEETAALQEYAPEWREKNLLKPLISVSNLTKVDLSHCQMGYSNNDDLSHFSEQSLSCLNVFFNSVGMSYFSGFISCNKLTELDLSDNHFDQDMSVLIAFRNVLKRSQSITKLNLENNNLNIIRMLPDGVFEPIYWNKIIHLNLSGNVCAPDIIPSFVTTLELSPALESLTLTNTGISDEDKQRLKEKVGNRFEVFKF